MTDIPFIVFILFGLAVVFTMVQFYASAQKSLWVAVLLIACALFQSGLGISGFYQQAAASPPRFPLLVAPGLLIASGLLLTRPGRQFLDRLDIRNLTWLHVVRVPVEITLFYLYIARLVPVEMTFEGRNFDILSGVSAMFIYYFAFISQRAGRRTLLLWNVVCLFLLVNIVSTAILSAKTPFQQLGFDQPNVGVTLFPFVLLPALIVPLVLIAHLAAIRQLLTGKPLAGHA